MDDLYRIVVGIDFEPTGDEALHEAISLARAVPSAELHLVHVVIERRGSPSATRLAQDELRLAAAQNQLREHIETWQARWHGQPLDRPMVQHVRLGDAAEGIHQVAVDVDADLVVVGTNDKTRLSRMVLGSTSRHLVELAHAPVLVARPKDYRGLSRSATKPEAARPGTTEADLHAPPSYELRGRLELGTRATHVSGIL
jgi:nucleotide-binding universal stress UspA family protein